MTDVEKVVLVGGGLPALFAALVYSQEYPDLDIYIIEKGTRVGGTYGSIQHDQAGVFDHGMHLIYTTTNSIIDKYIYNCLDEQEWNILEGNSKDIAGVYFGGKLNKKSPYLDLNYLANTNRIELFSSLFEALNTPGKKPTQCKNAFEYYQSKFGRLFTEQIIDPILQKLWGHEAVKLSPHASKLVLMDRVNFFSHDTMLDLFKSELLRSRIGFPDQMKLPIELKSSQVGLYPKRFGMQFLIDKIQQILIQRGVNIYLGSQINEFQIQNNFVTSISIEKNDKIFSLDNVKQILWTIPAFPLKSLLKIDQQEKVKMDPPRAQQNVYLLLKNPPDMGDIYYFFCLERNFKTFRVTNYHSYCSDALRSKSSKYPHTYPICIEMHFSNPKEIKPDDLLDRAIDEMLKFGVLKSREDVVFSSVGEHFSGFPVLTNNNIEAQRLLKNSVEELKPKNLIIAGQEPEKGVFFFHEIIEQMYYSIEGLGGHVG